MSQSSGSGRLDHQGTSIKDSFCKEKGKTTITVEVRTAAAATIRTWETEAAAIKTNRSGGSQGGGNRDLGNRSGGRNNGRGGELDGEGGTLPSDCTPIPIPKRPGFGTSERRVKVETNHFLTTKEGSTIYHYNVTILSPSGLTKQMRQELVLTLNSMRRFHKDCFGNQMVKTNGILQRWITKLAIATGAEPLTIGIKAVYGNEFFLREVAKREGKYLVELFNKIGKQNGGKVSSANDIPLGDPFVYKHLGSMASVGGYKALVDLRQSKLADLAVGLSYTCCQLEEQVLCGGELGNNTCVRQR
ncbi:internal alternative NAD(P)H-ubiquinone oxidoreductase A1, mitochondrial-like [Fagus crenata]